MASSWGYNASQVKMTFQLLDRLLEKHYDNSMDTLVSKSKTPIESKVRAVLSRLR
jgi:hypothetical protein